MTAKAKKETTVPEKAMARNEKVTEPLMYVGPTVNGIGIQNRVYSEIPGRTKEVLEKVPELKNLFIPIREYPEACKMLRERKGYIYSAFTKALTLKNGGL